MNDHAAAVPAVEPKGIADLPDAALLDVREAAEWGAGHAPGARHIALDEVPGRIAEVPRDRTVVCICRSGNRSARAVALLRAHGIDAVNLTGGMRAWAAEGKPVVTDSGASGAVV